MTLRNAFFVRTAVAAVLLVPFFEAPRASGQDAPALDYEFYKKYVEPVFINQRVDHARCYVCHEEGRNRLRLEKLLPGKTYWTEEQSKQNFLVASHIVVPGSPEKSRMLMHPLAPEAGGDPTPMGIHYGGRQFPSKDDPDWKKWADWVRGAKVAK
jgi:hypothetical protein